ncbi:MAG TPA: hypothetical protein PK299_01955 [Anaerolineales bacterium]|nr:hypothetical protein [Anaerolineales bacterium]
MLEPAWRWWTRFVLVPLVVAVISAIIINMARTPSQTIVITVTPDPKDDFLATLQAVASTATAEAKQNNLSTPVPTQTPVLTIAVVATQSVLPTISQPLPVVSQTALAPIPSADAQLPVFTCLAPAWAGYYPLQLIDVQGLDQQLGFDLQIIPAGYPGIQDYTENEMANALQNGEIDCLLNTLDSLALRGPYGVLTAFVDEVAGADEIWVRDPSIVTLNDLNNHSISFAANSTAEYMTYYWLAIPGLFPASLSANGSNICPQTGIFHPAPADSTQLAVEMFQRGEVDAVLGWQPEITLAQAPDTRKLADDSNIRMSIDVLLVSPNSIANRNELVLRFHEAWFLALQQMFNNPDESAQALVNWANSKDAAYADWMGLDVNAPGESLRAALAPIAQATLYTNQALFESPNDIYDLLRYQQQIWRSGGRSDLANFDYASAVDVRYVNALKSRTDLSNHAPPINSDFSFGARSSTQNNASGQILASLPLIFDPNDAQLSFQGRQVLEQCIIPILRHTTNSIKVVITASSAWPGPEGSYTEADIYAYAQQRANNVKLVLVNNQIDPNQIVEEILIPPTERRNVLDPNLLAQDRFVRIRLEELGR